MARSRSSKMAVLTALVHLEDRKGPVAPEGPVAPQGLIVLEAQIALAVPLARARLSDQAHPDRKPPALPP